MALPMDGESFLVLSIEPAPAPPEAPREPVLFNAPGSVTLDGGVLRLEGGRGEGGVWDDLLVLGPPPPGRAVGPGGVTGKVGGFPRPGAGAGGGGGGVGGGGWRGAHDGGAA